ncbi:hypothetical protein [Nocardia sp. NPDC005745]|uniref:hypothetical protein n=1 Tax=Nocardia sp. NPDC005745 TaxID=3157061 RepID=UPI0033F3C3DD
MCRDAGTPGNGWSKAHFPGRGDHHENRSVVPADVHKVRSAVAARRSTSSRRRGTLTLHYDNGSNEGVDTEQAGVVTDK